MEFTFLGTGTSTGVPLIGCQCKTCLSGNPKDKRLRASVLITENGTNILIDSGPDFRQQMLSYRINQLTHILVTHHHYDHIGGLDDVRPLGNVNIYGEETTLDIIRHNMPYCFGEDRYPGVPNINLQTIQTDLFYVENMPVQPIRAMHAKLPILGYRFNKLAYLTDVKTIGQESIEQLTDLNVLILNALRPQTHISHLSLSEAVELAKTINARETYFTHMSHDMGLHDEVNKHLPEGIQLAYDGLKLEI